MTPFGKDRAPTAIAAAAVAIALVAGVIGYLLGRESDGSFSREMRLELITPPTTDPISLAVSTDGLSIVFVASVEGRSRLWVRRLESGTQRELAGTEYASFPFWSPDNGSIGFFADGRIKQIELETGLVRVITTALVPAGATWNRDGVIVYPVVPDSPLPHIGCGIAGHTSHTA